MTRLLVIGEQGINTGFERVVRGITTHLHERGDYDITVRGIGYDPQRTTRRYPYVVKPVAGTHEDPFGANNFRLWLDEDDPEVILINHDLWQSHQYLIRLPEDIPTVLYTPVDAPNLKPSYALDFCAVSEAVMYTNFGAAEAAIGVRGALDTLEKSMMLSRGPDDYMERLELPRGGTKLQGRWDRLQRYQNPGNYNVIPHGHTPGIFEPRDQTEARELLGIPRDAFVVLNVATNSPRKRLDLTIRAFARLAHLRKEAILVIHCNGGGGTNGWDLTSAAHYYGVADRVILTHLLYPNLSDDQLCWLYNTADIQVNTSGGEGWSLCSFEGAECGLPQLVPDWSATRELWGQHGYLIPVKDTRMEPKFLNTVHACIDTQALGDRMVELADNQFERASMSDLALQRASLQHSWDSVGEAFSSVIQHALSEPVPQPVSFNELNAARIGHITSEGSLG